MTAAEIREHYHDEIRPPFEPQDAGSMMQALIRVQAEIAAQLAELNAHLAKRDGSGLSVTLCASNDAIPVRVLS